MSQEKDLSKLLKRVYSLLLGAIGLSVTASALIIFYFIDPSLSSLTPKQEAAVTAPAEDKYKDEIVDGIHVRTGLIEAEGLMAVVSNCTVCHSSKLVIQNRMNRERWDATIKWMQETQNLWDLGENHEVIVDYLVTNYPPKKKGRRENLQDIEWYVLEN